MHPWAGRRQFPRMVFRESLSPLRQPSRGRGLGAHLGEVLHRLRDPLPVDEVVERPHHPRRGPLRRPRRPPGSRPFVRHPRRVDALQQRHDRPHDPERALAGLGGRLPQLAGVRYLAARVEAEEAAAPGVRQRPPVRLEVPRRPGRLGAVRELVHHERHALGGRAPRPLQQVGRLRPAGVRDRVAQVLPQHVVRQQRGRRGEVPPVHAVHEPPHDAGGRPQPARPERHPGRGGPGEDVVRHPPVAALWGSSVSRRPAERGKGDARGAGIGAGAGSQGPRT